MTWKRNKEPQVQFTPTPPPTFLSRLRKQREADLAELQQLDAVITELESQITWLERHPQAEGILQTLSQRFQR